MIFIDITDIIVIQILTILTQTGISSQPYCYILLKGSFMDHCVLDPLFPDADEDNAGKSIHNRCRQVIVQFKEGEPICDVDELVQQIVTRSIHRYDAADEADRELDLIMLKRRGIDFRLGELLTLFKNKKGEDYLGHRSIGTFSVEHLSFSGRLASELMRNSGLLSALPLTKEAYLQGEIKKSALRHLSRVLTPENEAEWIAKTKKLSLKALERMVRKALQKMKTVEENDGERDGPSDADCSNGGERGSPTGADIFDVGECGNTAGANGSTGDIRSSTAGTDSFDDGERDGSPDADCSNGSDHSNDCNIQSDQFKTDQVEPYSDDIPSEESTEPQKGLMMHLNVSNRLAPFWDFALAHFRNSEQVNGSTSTFVEALLANYITSGKRSGDIKPSSIENAELPVFYSCYMKKPEREERPVDDELQIPAGKSLPGDPEDEEEYVMRQIIFPPSFYQTPETVDELADKLVKLARYRQELDVGMAKILWAIDEWDLYRVLGCSHFEEYGRKKCDLPNSMLHRLVRLAWGFKRRPLIAKAFMKGLISKEQARQILRISDEDNERIWIDYAAHSPSVTLREELERCVRIVDYDSFARSFYNILPGFRYITDERYGGLPDEVKKSIRTGSWYRRSLPELAWPLEENDEHMLMERDPRLEEPWRYFDDVDDFLAYEAEVSERKKNGLCTSQDDESRKLLCASLAGQEDEISQSYMGTDSFSKKEKPILEKRVNPLSHDEDDENRKILCASLAGQGDESSQSYMGTDSFSKKEKPISEKRVSPLSRYEEDESSQAGCDEKILSNVREICTMPHDAEPAETFLLDILADEISSMSRHSKMPIRFFLPEEFYELWNNCFAIYLRQSVADGTLIRMVHNVEDIFRNPRDYEESAEAFIAALLQQWLLVERQHFKVTRGYDILKRDRFRCQVPGCNCRRNLHIHHIIPRSHGGSNDPANLIVLCEKCHLRLLHDLHTLKIEGTAPFNLTFTFGSGSRRHGKPFLKYQRGRKVLLLS